MAQIIVTIPNASISRILEAFATKYEWTSELGVTKTDFAKQQVVRYIRQTVTETEGELQAEQIKQAVKNDIEAIAIT